MPARHVVAALAVSAAALLGTSGIAAASGDVRVPGARLTFDSAAHVFRLFDTADDGHKVYAKWQVQGYPKDRADNIGGPGSVLSWAIPVTRGLKISYQVCVDNPLQATCSPVKQDRT